MNSCKTSNEVIKRDFPQPYDVNGELIVTYDQETELVKMPLWYWIKITEYAIDTQGVK